MDVSKDSLHKNFLAEGFTEFTDPLEPMHVHAAGPSLKSKFHDIDTREHSYTIVIAVFDLHKIPNYPRNQKRFVYEATVRYYGNGMVGDDEIPQTTISYTVNSVKQATDHAYRMWQAMGRTTE